MEQLEERDIPPFGGFAWDGRFDTLNGQATFPLLSPDEMANDNPVSILGKLRNASYARAFEQAFGSAALTDPGKALDGISLALQRFELADPSFHPYSSKFDAALDGKGRLSVQELHGQQLFNDPNRGNCATCHTSSQGADGSHPLFTNFQFEALGVPRNPEIAANRDPHFYDLGLCGPSRKDLAAKSELCGMFKTPSLRNVATRGAFFHNGRFHTLRKALEFYVRRDTNPEQFYPVTRNGSVLKFDDLPARYRDNVDIVDLPLTKHKGEQPIWSDRDIDDVIAFLQTLTDGYKTP
jgi:cytochrome c peroxidase